jgi:hypothetical protein
VSDTKYKILFFGASYGSLFGVKAALRRLAREKPGAGTTGRYWRRVMQLLTILRWVLSVGSIVALMLPLTVLGQDAHVPELDGIWELNRGWTNHPDDNPDTYTRTDFRAYTRPEVLAVWDERDPLSDPKLLCQPPTVSSAMSGIHAIAIDQSGEHVILFAEAFDIVRTVYMDGREHLAVDTPHTNLGHSIGRYEGETLVVDTTHITAGWNIGPGGPPHSDQLHVVERYRVINDGKLLEQAVTVTDPLTLTQPVTYVQHERRASLHELVPYDCMPLNTDRGAEMTPEEFYTPKE